MKRPTLLVIAGLDPSGGAGLAADIEAAIALGAYPAPVASLLTVQDSRRVLQVMPLDPALVRAQAEAVLADLRVAAVKLGALGTAAIGTAVADLLERHRQIPVVTDPVLAASGGGEVLGEPALLALYRERIFPRSLVATPNRAELAALAPGDGAAELVALGLPACLVTDGDGRSERIVHELHTVQGIRLLPGGPRLPGVFHGTGCSFASAIAARVAVGDSLEEAIDAAERFLRRALAQAFVPGAGQAVPGRW
ncbi:MAG TPA: hydroxymethylpyrimidine/phosphomethylpyrimidine kinase [Gammaproteobacteria bacterium]|nr:hydroxymethylpyrimidine/phosphomethylpyrimidine kinase [Gammaproteobacteria bacterium]